MPISPRTKRHRISARAAEEIARRADAARRDILDETGRLVQFRGGLDALTAPQAEAVTELLADTPAAPSLATLRRLLAPTDAEAAALSLRRLVSERLRSEQRRRAEGAKPAAEAQAARAAAAERPWVAAGVSRATWYRQQRAVAMTAAREAVRQAEMETGGGQGAGETRADPIQKEEKGSEEGKGRPRSKVAPSLTAAPAPPRLPRMADLETAEARRYTATALRAGCRWSDGLQWSRPMTWFTRPPDLPADAAAVLDTMAAVAEASLERREAVVIARARRTGPTPERAERQIDPQACPPTVRADVWQEVPAHLCPRVRRRAALAWVKGVEANAAVVQSIVPAAREAALVAALADAAPELDAAACERLAQQYAGWPLADGVRHALADVADRLSRRAAAEAAAAAAVDAADPPIPPADRAAVIARAAAMLATESCRRDAADVAHAVALARQVVATRR
ncbi:conserved protein of unknown function (plasmid) [Rhodovastum atsumiense]|uniref:Uncharacterized protein n=1 Tax=Rhodovastum atsumiense TaxID=504468 RepID=A0A5M6ITZ9_9PROT|nr:hypothetical protein [Rhodovastum atsumiense]KAA5611790.1 hypothetical protein F1189_12175 [Rhodovastum atsumiense]CAH2606103.1 conserved protein of unknown function [Rhodovastum atsumiense]